MVIKAVSVCYIIALFERARFFFNLFISERKEEAY